MSLYPYNSHIGRIPMAIETKKQLFDLIKSETSVGGLDGAYLASLLHHKHGDPLKKLGYARLSEAIEDAEQAGYVRRDKSVKHLRILPPEGSRPASQSETKNYYIDRDFWHALFLNEDGLASVYDKIQEKVLPRPATQAESQHEIPIEPIGSQTQEEWLAEFIASEGIETDIPTRDLLPNADKLGQQHSKRWKYERTSRTITELKKWAEQNDINPSIIFRPVSSRARTESQAAIDDSTSELRKSITAAVSQMDESQLKDLSKSIVICLYSDHANS